MTRLAVAAARLRLALVTSVVVLMPITAFAQGTINPTLLRVD